MTVENSSNIFLRDDISKYKDLKQTKQNKKQQERGDSGRKFTVFAV